MPKKILIFSTAYLPLVGGAEIAIKEITDRTGEAQFDMITLRFDSRLPKLERLGNINVYRLGFSVDKPAMADLVSWPLKLNKILFPFLACAKACRLNRKNNYNLIWAMMAAYAGFAAMFFKTCHKNLPYLLTLQEGDPFEEIKKKARLVSPLFKRIFTKADFIQAISNYLADFARQMGYRGELAVVPNGVDVDKFSPRSPSEAGQAIFHEAPMFNRDSDNIVGTTFGTSNFQFSIKDIKNKLGFFENDKVVITASRLVKKNAVDDVIKSLEYLPANVKFLILGDGPDRKKLAGLAGELNLSNRIIFFGAYDNDDLPQYLAIADIFVRPSLSEGQGISFLEAMAAGVPVIATPVGGIVDFLKDGETGLFCEVNNPRSIAKKVEELLNNKELAEKIKISAKNMVEKDYDWNLIAKKMEVIFNSVIASDRRDAFSPGPEPGNLTNN